MGGPGSGRLKPTTGSAPPRTRRQARDTSKAEVLSLRQQGYSTSKIASMMGISVGMTHALWVEAIQDAAKLREEIAPHMLEVTLQGFDQLEEMILANGRINLDARIRMLELAEQEFEISNPPPDVRIEGFTRAQLTIELARLRALRATTYGMVNEDLDRLAKIRDRRAQYMGVEPAQKVDIEHTFVLKASEAQSKLRAKLGMSVVSSAPKDITPGADAEVSADVIEGESVTSSGGS